MSEHQIDNGAELNFKPFCRALRLKAAVLFLLPALAVSAGKLTVDFNADQIGRHSRAPLRCTFSEPMIRIGFPKYSVPQGLSVEPAISGTWSWESQSTLIFSPDSEWLEVNYYTVTIPAGIESTISHDRLKRSFTTRLSTGRFSASWRNPGELRSTVDSVEIGFSLAVHPDSLRKHLSGAPESIFAAMPDGMSFHLLPKGGWPTGRRINLSIDRSLTPLGGNLPLDTAVSTSFMVSDTLACLGLFRDGVRISPSDTLFLEDDYKIRFNRPLHHESWQDYALVNGKSAEFELSETEISIKRFLTPGKPCTLSFNAGMPSDDSAFLFKDMKFVLVGDSNRIDPGLPPFKIRRVTARYTENDSISPIPLDSAVSVPLTMAMTLGFSISPDVTCDDELVSGRIYCRTSMGTDTLFPRCNSGLLVRPTSFPEQSNCTLLVKAGFRAGGRQLKKDYIVTFRTGKARIPDECRPVIDVWEDNSLCKQYGSGRRFLLLPDSPAVPLERYGAPRVISAIRNITTEEALMPYTSTRFSPHQWIFDTLALQKTNTNWYDFLPISLAPALSPHGRGCAEVLLSVNNKTFDTLGQFEVTDIGLQLLNGRLATGAVVTSLTKRTPVPGADVAFIGQNRTMLAQGTTDSLGLLKFSGHLSPRFVRVTAPGDTFVHQTGREYAGDTMAAAGNLFTERGLYRPGDTVYFKGVVRRLLDYWVPVSADSAVVTIAWNGATPFIDTLPMIGTGSFSGAVAVPVDVQRSRYTITAEPLRARCHITCEITIADIRPAELAGVAGTGIIDGDSVRFPVFAKWLHGGTAGGCPLSWKCYIGRSLNYPSSYGIEIDNRNESRFRKDTSGASLLDSTGRATIAVARFPQDSGAAYCLTVTVEGSAVQSIQMYQTVDIPWSHRIMVGYLPTAEPGNGDTVVYYFKAIRENREFVKGCRLRAGIVQHKVVKRRAANRCGLPAIIRDTVDAPLPMRRIVTDSAGIAVVRQPSLPVGSYTLTVSPPGADTVGSYVKNFIVDTPDSGRLQLSDERNADDEDAFNRFTNDFTVAEIDTGIHNVGDTVRLKVSTTSDSCRVALVVRRENIYEYRWIEMAGRDTIITLTISDFYIPVVAINASFFPPLRKSGGKFSFFQPSAIMYGGVKIRVSPESRRIPVNITTDRSIYTPGDSVTVFLSLPPKFASSTALVMAVDEGILRLGLSRQPDIFETFDEASRGRNNFYIIDCFKCLHGQYNYDSLNHLHLQPRRGDAGIGYGAGYGSSFDGSGHGGIDDIVGGLMGGYGVDGLELKADGTRIIRNPPRPCAYFNPQVSFDANGKAACRFMLPGNLTRWRVTAVVDDTTSFGEDTVSFESNKPLMVRPQLPRFLRVGDSASAVYIVENRSKDQRNIASGVTARSNTTVDTFTLQSNEVRQCRFPLIGRATGVDSLLFIARSDTLGDGTIQTLPTIYERPRDVAAIGGSTIDSAHIPVMFPKPSTIDSGSLTLSLSTTRMQNLAEGVRYLFDYPYGCLEQQSSRIMPLLMLSDFTRRFNLPMLSRGDEEAMVRTYLAHIGDFQSDSDGGLGYWPSDSGSSSPWLTAFVLETMIRAKANGYAISDTVYSRALGYLKREMGHRDSDGRKQYLDSYTLLVTAEAGKPDRLALRRLCKEVKKLPLNMRINLLKAMHVAGGFKRKVVALQKNLRRGFIEKDRLAYVAPEAAEGFEFCHESPVRLTAMALEALLETGSNCRFDEPMIRWLTEQRRSGRWRTTQENVAVFRAFTAYTNVYENDPPKLNAAVKLAGSDWFNAALVGREGANTHASRSIDSIAAKGETDVAVSLSGTGRLYWDLLMSTTPSCKAPAVSSGLTITRTVTPIGEDTQSPFDPPQLNVGQLLNVTVTIRCKQDITFAAINDPVPAGCEAVNPELNTGERDIAAKTTRWSGPAGLSHREFRDSRVLLFADEMPAGEYNFSYLLKVTTAGRFVWPAPFVEAMYYPEIFGRGEEGSVMIGEGR